MNPATRTPHDRAAVTIVATQLFFLLSVLLIYIWGRPLVGWTDTSLLHPASILLLVSFVWSLWSWKRLTGSIFDPYGLFLIAAFLFNAGSAFLYVFGINNSGLMILDFSFAPAVTLQTLLLVFLALGAFHLGALFIAGGNIGTLFPVPSAVDEESPSAAEIRFVGWALIIVSAVPMALQLKQAASVVLASGYFALYQQDYATGLQASAQFLASFLVPGALVLLAGSKQSRTGRLTAMGVITLYALVQLFLGSRYHAIGPVIAYVLALAPGDPAGPALAAPRRCGLRFYRRFPGSRRDAEHERRGSPLRKHASARLFRRQQSPHRRSHGDGRHNGDDRAHADARTERARL